MDNQPKIDTRPAHRRGRPTVDDNEKKRAATFRLSPEAHRLIGALGIDMGLSQASVVETAVRDLAKTRGVK
jgi:hypothetical protein